MCNAAHLVLCNALQAAALAFLRGCSSEGMKGQSLANAPKGWQSETDQHLLITSADVGV